MLPKLVIIGIVGLIVLIFLAALFVIASAVIAAFVFGTTGGTTQVHQYPSVAVHRVNATALSVTFMDTGGAASIKGLRILQPSLAQPNVVDPNTDISIGQPIIFSDQSLSSPAHLVVASTVDGKEQVVYDGKV